MRFLFVSDFVADPNSGAAGTLIAIAGALERAGHAVDLVWKDQRPYRLRHATAARLLELPGRQRRQVEARLRAAAYDVVAVSQPYAYRVFERVAARHPGTLFINRTHGWEGRLYQARRAFDWDGPASPRLAARASAGLTRRACRRAAQAAHGIVTGSLRCAEWIRRAYGLPDGRVVAIPYGLDPALAPARAPTTTPHPPGGALGLLYVGNYLPLKGSNVLEDALPPLGERFPEARLTLVVDPGARERVTARFRRSWGDRLTVHPWLERSRLSQVYAEHDVLLYPSLFEGFGKVWLEAMAFGLCPVGFAEGGLPDIARHEEHALYCPTGDEEGLEVLLDRVLSAPEQARAIGRRAAVRVREFTWDRTAAETVAFCQRIAAGR